MGNWMQMDTDLPEKPEVQQICDLTAIEVALVIGRLFLFWRWVDRHAKNGTITLASRATLIRIIGGDENFWAAVEKVGWLSVTNDGLSIPGWKKRFSKSAKQRHLAAQRQARVRAKKVTHQRDASVTRPLPRIEKNGIEKNREDKNTNTLPPPAASARASAYDPDFEIFWKTYPRGEGKKLAAKSWEVAVKGVALRPEVGSRAAAVAFILEAAKEFAESPKGKSEFCPHPAPWLNQNRFDDDRSMWYRVDSRAPAKTTAHTYTADDIG